MKYLKKYKLFESISIDNIKETFYNISDIYSVYISKTKDNFIKILICTNENENIDTINYNEIKDDLEFAISYIINELKLTFDELTIYNDGYAKKIEFVAYTFEDLINFNNIIYEDEKIISHIILFFSMPKNEQNLV